MFNSNRHPLPTEFGTASDLVSAPNIGNVLSHYYTEIEQRNLRIEELIEPKDPPLSRPEQRIYLIESIYMTVQQKEMVNHLLSVDDGRQVQHLPGFNVYQLKLKTPN